MSGSRSVGINAGIFRGIAHLSRGLAIDRVQMTVMKETMGAIAENRCARPREKEEIAPEPCGLTINGIPPEEKAHK